ncbi:hypothetical protein L210DRAFT_934203 [Boletus edulis BED1]|uniref:Uncharacterized protein n=1 Tax=Boletus edulis BED1 TaxID=1328754 RepID=A0AAD4G6A3_BOLED|nr:hypothetical protein L210DRAFT_3656051 [Boletus edulis BED1]KAF8439288.1 hypothetical protein L210DRAFT_934203 [Boletus edulis BED1]
MPTPESKKLEHRRASTAGKGVPSVWLPNPGGSVVYIAGGPPTPALSASSSSASVPSRKRKRGMHSLPHVSNVFESPGKAPARSSVIDGVDDDKVVNFFTAAFKMIAHNVEHLPDSEHKRNISNVLRSFTQVLPDCEKPGNLHGDEDANAT